jgi:hypothetical protein
LFRSGEVDFAGIGFHTAGVAPHWNRFRLRSTSGPEMRINAMAVSDAVYIKAIKGLKTVLSTDGVRFPRSTRSGADREHASS